ncbi:uncharacterized protein LOC9652367 isoform X1 [Selaginella moellendorffii]|nr:uncharacterized protein LOC9652367 isoform X1 [Selaginella moellendorffii]|eukprot:XP_002966592.2 uncharacterized protein LOC9652367 isoform X1 [Selaginella moellendorffii]
MAVATSSCGCLLPSRALNHSVRTRGSRAVFLRRVEWSVVLRPMRSPVLVHCSSNAAESTAEPKPNDDEENEDDDDDKKAFERLEQYIELNRGSWSGTFTQYDCLGKVLACIPIKLRANVYGKGEHLALYQTLCVKQAESSTSFSGDAEDVQWLEFNLADLDSVTINQRHRVGYFGDEKAYCLSHLTAKVLDVVLRAGVLGENDDEEQDYFPGVKLPCRRPALVNESCMFSASGNSRVRAFHVLNPQGLLDMIGVFHENKDGEAPESMRNDCTGLDRLVGVWSGRAVTQRTGMYGSTIAEEYLDFRVDMNDKSEITQTISSSSSSNSEAGATNKQTNLTVKGMASGNLVRFTDGLQSTLLPGGMCITAPISVGNCVKKSRSFFLEFAWIESPNQRRRIIRTYDTTGVVVSTTLCNESKQI